MAARAIAAGRGPASRSPAVLMRTRVRGTSRSRSTRPDRCHSPSAAAPACCASERSGQSCRSGPPATSRHTRRAIRPSRHRRDIVKGSALSGSITTATPMPYPWPAANSGMPTFELSAAGRTSARSRPSWRTFQGAAGARRPPPHRRGRFARRQDSRPPSTRAPDLPTRRSSRQAVPQRVPAGRRRQGGQLPLGVEPAETRAASSLLSRNDETRIAHAQRPLDARLEDALRRYPRASASSGRWACAIRVSPFRGISESPSGALRLRRRREVDGLENNARRARARGTA